MQKLKTLTLSLVVGMALAGGIALAAIAPPWDINTWHNPNEWISDGAIISAQKIAENFEYLKSRTSIHTTFINPPTCVGVGKLLQWNGSDWLCTLLDQDPYLYNNVHKESECQGISGVVINVNGKAVCQYAGGTCPNGWSTLANKTSAKSCQTWTQFTYCLSPRYGGKCTTGSHTAWQSNTETCVYYAMIWRSCRRGAAYTCTADITEVACY